MRLHHRVRLIGRGVRRIELDRRRGERAGEVADGRVRRAAGNACGLVAASFAAARSNAPLAADVVDAEELRGGARLLERLGDDQRDRLVIVLNLGTAEQPGRVPLGLAERAGVLAP